MATGHEIILVAGILCLLATFAGLVSARIDMPLLLVLLDRSIGAMHEFCARTSDPREPLQRYGDPTARCAWA